MIEEKLNNKIVSIKDQPMVHFCMDYHIFVNINCNF